MSPHDITAANFAQLLEKELVRLTAKIGDAEGVARAKALIVAACG